LIVSAAGDGGLIKVKLAGGLAGPLPGVVGWNLSFHSGFDL